MKKLLLLLLFASTAQAAPFLVSDPIAAGQADTCVYQEGAVVTRTPMVANACHADLTAMTVGTHNLTVWFELSTATPWVAGPSVPFTFVRPALISTPATLRLAP